MHQQTPPNSSRGIQVYVSSPSVVLSVDRCAGRQNDMQVILRYTSNQCWKCIVFQWFLLMVQYMAWSYERYTQVISSYGAVTMDVKVPFHAERHQHGENKWNFADAHTKNFILLMGRHQRCSTIVVWWQIDCHQYRRFGFKHVRWSLGLVVVTIVVLPRNGQATTSYSIAVYNNCKSIRWLPRSARLGNEEDETNATLKTNPAVTAINSVAGGNNKTPFLLLVFVLVYFVTTQANSIICIIQSSASPSPHHSLPRLHPKWYGDFANDRLHPKWYGDIVCY